TDVVRELAGRVAVVTGGASGIGRAMASRFRDEGVAVVIADLEADCVRATADELGVHGVVTDVSDLASVEALAAEVLERHGAIHLVCNNAGVNAAGSLAASTIRDWQWVVGVNLWGVVHGVHVFLPHLLDNPDGGHLVNTSSMAGLLAVPNVGIYSATKFAVVSISETLAIELAGTPVGVSVLCPGMVDTNIRTSERNRPAALRDDGDARPPATDLPPLRGSDPMDVAGAVVDAVRDDRFWILTHPDAMAAVDARHRALMAAATGH
ncbi:MAG: SDR family NAD(P)-dependent oxidoreductase, partial [Ilumatobacteraceae bacterium]